MSRIQRFIRQIPGVLAILLGITLPATAQREDGWSERERDYGRPGYEETITCESENNRYNRCRADIRGHVRLIQKISDAPCIEGRSWGYDNRGIWVDKGCRARFAYRRHERDREHGQEHDRRQTITCESENNRYNFCRARTDGRVRLIQKISDAPCVEGRSWGYDNRGIWVNRGCRARFAYGR